MQEYWDYFDLEHLLKLLYVEGDGELPHHEKAPQEQQGQRGISKLFHHHKLYYSSSHTHRHYVIEKPRIRKQQKVHGRQPTANYHSTQHNPELPVEEDASDVSQIDEGAEEAKDISDPVDDPSAILNKRLHIDSDEKQNDI